MATFESARIQTAARGVGVGQAALEEGLRYAEQRIQFGRPIADFPRVGRKIARMVCIVQAARQLTLFAARMKDSGKRCNLEAGMAKLLATRAAWESADASVQIHGGNGYAEEYVVSRLLVDARVLSIFEGANEIQAHVVARRLFEVQRGTRNDDDDVRIRPDARGLHRRRGLRPPVGGDHRRGCRRALSGQFSRCDADVRERALRKNLGLEGRPVHPLLLLNYGLSFSVHDVSEQAIAHLAYVDVRFPEACYAGETLTATSKVLGAKATSAGDRGVVHVATVLRGDGDKVVCAFERKALVRSGKLATRPSSGLAALRESAVSTERLPSAMRTTLSLPGRNFGFAGFARASNLGACSCTRVARQSKAPSTNSSRSWCGTRIRSTLTKSTARVGRASAGTRVVYGGLVLSWVASLASRDTLGNVLWDMGLDNGAHPNGVVAGDTLFAASKVLAREPHDAKSAKVTFRLVGTKNVRADKLLQDGADLFTSELSKKEGKIKEKVVEIDRPC